MKCLSCFVLLCLAITPARAADVPRYKLPAGRVLHYSSGSKFQILVLAENPDGSSRLLERTDQATPRLMSVCDVFPDGRVLADPADLRGQMPGNLFARLPADATQMAGSWSNDVEWTGESVQYSAGTQDGGQFVFKALTDGPPNRVLGSQIDETFHFDVARGLVSEAAIQRIRGPIFRIKFEREDSIDAPKLAALAHDYALYFQARRQHGALRNTILKDPANARKILDSARAILAAAVPTISQPDVAAELQLELKTHDASAGNKLDEATALLDVLDKPAPNWAAEDLTGKRHSSRDLHGKIVVMDFWYRDCPYCVYGMPQLRRLVARYTARGVVFLGMNTDRDLADARFAARELSMDYPQIQAAGLSDKFGVQGFPTLIVIDPAGIVRAFHAGSSNLEADISARLDDLLPASGDNRK